MFVVLLFQPTLNGKAVEGAAFVNNDEVEDVKRMLRETPSVPPQSKHPRRRK